MSSTRGAHIVYVIGGLWKGGAEAQMVLLARRASRERLKITVWTLFFKGFFQEDLQGEGIIVHGPKISIEGGFKLKHLIFTDFLINLWQLFVFLKIEKPQIVHTFLPESSLIGGAISQLAGVPIWVASRRSRNLFRNNRPLFRRLEDFFNRRASLLIGNSQAVVNDLLSEGNVRNRVHLIYNGVDISRFNNFYYRSSYRQQLKLPDEALCLIMVANLTAYKGHKDLLQALANIKEIVPGHWKLLLVGEDYGIRDELVRLVARVGIEQHVCFLGARDDVPEILSSADIGILSSHQEGFSNAILEYMAAGLPVLATDVGGNAEALTCNEGLVVPLGNLDSLGKAICHLMLDPKLRTSMGRSGRQRVKRIFSAEKMVNEHIKVYKGLMASCQ